MKKLVSSLLFICLILASFSVFAEDKNEKATTYQRSSLSLILMDDPSLAQREIIKAAFLGAPVPDKYNDHNISIRSFDPTQYKVEECDIAAYEKAIEAGKDGGGTATAVAKKKSFMGGLVKELAQTSAASVTVAADTSDKATHAIITNKYLIEQKAAKQLFDKWYLDNEGQFSVSLMQERGMYGASALKIKEAQNSSSQWDMLKDSGEELIGKTFVVVSRFRYLSKEQLCDEIEAASEAVASQFGGGGYASIGMLAVKAAMGAGYYVRTTSYLFQLAWNEEISARFYKELWNNRENYDQSDLFSLKYIGEQSAWANVPASIFTDKPDEELINIATINATNSVLAKLEQEYDVFKTKTPIFSIEPFTAKIGTKEGIKAGDKYEVLEAETDKTTGATKYVRKGVVKVAKGKIWDNSYTADLLAAKEGAAAQDITATTFEGSVSGLHTGMFLKQIK